MSYTSYLVLMDTPSDWRPHCFAWGEGHKEFTACKACPFRVECLKDEELPPIEEESIAYA